MNHISDLPLLNLNAVDDPCIVPKAYDVPRKHARKSAGMCVHAYACICMHVVNLKFILLFLLAAGNHSKSLFVLSQHGGHLGFFEGTLLRPRSETWIDRMVVEFGEACLAASL